VKETPTDSVSLGVDSNDFKNLLGALLKTPANTSSTTMGKLLLPLFSAAYEIHRESSAIVKFNWDDEKKTVRVRATAEHLEAMKKAQNIPEFMLLLHEALAEIKGVRVSFAGKILVEKFAKSEVHLTDFFTSCDALIQLNGIIPYERSRTVPFQSERTDSLEKKFYALTRIPQVMYEGPAPFPFLSDALFGCLLQNRFFQEAFGLDAKELEKLFTA